MDNREWPDYEKNPMAEEFRKLFVGGLNSSTTDETINEYFSTFGTIEKCDIMKDRSNPTKSKGFAFITFAAPEAIDEVQKGRPHELDTKKIETKRATPKAQQYWPTKKLYIKDFPKDLEEDDLVAEMKEVFGKFGTVKDVHLVKEKDGALKGFGFIEFEDEDPVDKCNLYRKFTIKGASAKVAKAFSQDKNQFGGGRRNFNYYGGQGQYQDYYNYDYYGYPPYGGYQRGGGADQSYGRNNYGYNNNDFYRGGNRGYTRGGGGRPYRGGRYN